jgi:hypothetical protein
MDAVTEVLLDRSRDAQKISGMVVLSLVLHGILLSAIALVPYAFSRPPQPRNVMTISLGGAPGPVQGRTAISAKPVQQVAPDATKKITPPALPKPRWSSLEAAKPFQRRHTGRRKRPRPCAQAQAESRRARRVKTHGAQTPSAGSRQAARPAPT